MLMRAGQPFVGIIKVLHWFSVGVIKLAVLMVVAMLAACSQVKVSDYQNNQPLLIAEDFFNGPLSAHGVVKNRAGKVIRTFNATLEGRWQNGQGVLDEAFVFDDGEQQRRVWQLNPQGEGRYTTTAGDVTGEGHMQVAGNAVFMNYVLQVPYKGRTLEVAVDDRMYLVNPQTLINESIMYKWGFRVGAVLLVIQKAPAP